MEQLYNLEAFSQKTLTDKAFVNAMLSTFLQQGESAISDLKEALANKDLPAIQAIIHAIRPSAGYLNMHKLNSEMMVIEKWKGTIDDELNQLLASANQNLMSVMQAIRHDIDAAV